MTKPDTLGLCDDGGEGGVDGDLEGEQCLCVVEEDAKNGGEQDSSLVMCQDRCSPAQ